MVYLLVNLNPKFYKKGTKLLRENDELNEVNFIMKGVVFVGIQFNNVAKYLYSIKKGGLIGGYYCAQNSCLHHLQRGSAPGRAASGMIDWSLQQRGAGERCCLRRRVRGTNRVRCGCGGALHRAERDRSAKPYFAASRGRDRVSLAQVPRSHARAAARSAASSPLARVLAISRACAELRGVCPPAAGLVMPGYKRQPESS